MTGRCPRPVDLLPVTSARLTSARMTSARMNATFIHIYRMNAAFIRERGG
jgi:hypothetical protein